MTVFIAANNLVCNVWFIYLHVLSLPVSVCVSPLTLMLLCCKYQIERDFILTWSVLPSNRCHRPQSPLSLPMSSFLFIFPVVLRLFFKIRSFNNSSTFHSATSHINNSQLALGVAPQSRLMQCFRLRELETYWLLFRQWNSYCNILHYESLWMLSSQNSSHCQKQCLQVIS